MIKEKKKAPFSEQELKVVDHKKTMRGQMPIFNTPISYRENGRAIFLDKKPCWCGTVSDMGSLNSDVYNEKLSRMNKEGGHFDAFGVKWIFEPTAGGTISEAGHPLFDDVNDWKTAIKMPNVDEWDWQADADAHPTDTRFLVNMTPVNGFGFERLISFMDFVNVAMALVDEDQEDALKELLDALGDLGCQVVDKVCEYWPTVDIFTLHDDWGAQKAPFFSEEVAREIFLPSLKKICDHIHEKGCYVQLHSCGHTEDRINIFVEAGIDTWQMQTLNDWDKLYKEWGDKIIIQIPADELGYDYSNDESAREAARFIVDHYCEPGKPCLVTSKIANTSEAFLEELYKYSRIHYLAQE